MPKEPTRREQILEDIKIHQGILDTRKAYADASRHKTKLDRIDADIAALQARRADLVAHHEAAVNGGVERAEAALQAARARLREHDMRGQVSQLTRATTRLVSQLEQFASDITGFADEACTQPLELRGCVLRRDARVSWVMRLDGTTVAVHHNV